jgi:hypothetical protein
VAAFQQMQALSSSRDSHDSKSARSLSVSGISQEKAEN